MAGKTHFKCLQNILISRFYEQFWRDDSEMALELLSENVFNFSNMNILHSFEVRDLDISKSICNFLNILQFYEHFKKLCEICFC